MKKYKLPKFKSGGKAKDTHVTKDGKTAKKGLYYYMNRKKKKGTSNSKSKSTISDKAYKNMQKGFPKYAVGGLVTSNPTDPPKKSDKYAEFITKYYPVIKKIIQEEKLTISPRGFTTQLAIESGAGQSGLTRNYNNFGGYSATEADYEDPDKFVILETEEELNPAAKQAYIKHPHKEILYEILDEKGNPKKTGEKTRYKVKKGFKKFESVEEGLRKNIGLVSNERYSAAGTKDSLGNPEKYFQGLIAGGYATSSDYLNTNTNTYKKYEDVFNEIDQQELEAKEQKERTAFADKVSSETESIIKDIYQYPSQESTRVNKNSKLKNLFQGQDLGNMYYKKPIQNRYGGLTVNKTTCPCNYKKI